MKSLLSIHLAAAEQHPETRPKLKPFKLQTWKMSSLTWKGLLSLTIIASLLNTAPSAMAALLRRGDRGNDVYYMQLALGVPADGVFGAETEGAVIRFQQRCGLLVDGIAGPQTLNALATGNCFTDDFRPILPGEPGVGALPRGPYVVVVPVGGSTNRLAEVQRIVPGAALDDSSNGAFINAGGYTSRSAAETTSGRIRDIRLPARVDFRP